MKTKDKSDNKRNKTRKKLEKNKFLEGGNDSWQYPGQYPRLSPISQKISKVSDNKNFIPRNYKALKKSHSSHSNKKKYLKQLGIQ